MSNTTELTRESRTNTLAYNPLRPSQELELPPSLLPAARINRDLRDTYLGVQDAADLLNLGRTQVWRYVTVGHSKLGKLTATVLGTKRRPEYKFLRTDVEEFRERLEAYRQLESAGKALTRRSATDRHLRLAVSMLNSGKIDLGLLLEAATPRRPGRKPSR